MKHAPEYDKALEVWQLYIDLWGGTRTMREAGNRWLPQEPRESPQAYKNRLDRSVLFNAFKSTITDITAHPFSVPVRAEAAGLEDFMLDVDGTDRDFSSLLNRHFIDLLKFGVTHALVDFSDVSGAMSLADEKGARPIASVIHPPDLIYWDYDESGNLTIIRFKGTLRRDDKIIDVVHEFTRTTWATYEQKEDKWITIAEGPHSYGEVPLKTAYADDVETLMVSDSPFSDLAWLNIAHWQSSSDQRSALRFSRIGILFGTGLQEKEIEIGPNRAILTENPNATLKYVEHTGAAMTLGAKDLEDLEHKMELFGKQPFVDRTAASTATGKVIDESRALTRVQSWVVRIQDLGVKILEVAAKWRGITPEIDVEVFRDFVLADQAALGALSSARERGDIDAVTFLKELQRRNILSKDLDLEEVASDAISE